MGILFFILLLFIVSISMRWFVRVFGNYAALVPGILLLMFFIYLQPFIFKVSDGRIIEYFISWIPSLGINISLYLDGLSLFFLLIVSGIGSMIFIFSSGYMKPYGNKHLFFIFLTFFTASMLGLVVSGNLILLYGFWELTSVSSYLLIGFNHDKAEARSGALQAFLLTVIGGLSLLAGIILLGNVAGTFELNGIMERGAAIKSHDLYPLIIVLVFIGAATKSAQFPFHFWLPGAMQAPAPVSAFLHSATMVKAGFFLLARLYPVLGSSALWNILPGLAGAITMVSGAYLAINQTDIKRILAYTTVSALGTLFLLLGVGTEASFKAAIIFLLVHSLYKGALFMIAGIIEKKQGTRDIRELGGLFSYFPWVSLAALLSLFSMAGLPPFLGFIGKELIYEAKLYLQSPGAIITVFAIFANVVMVFISIYLAYHLFFKKFDRNKKVHFRKFTFMEAGPVILSLMSLLMGIFPLFLTDPVVNPAILSIEPSSIEVSLKLWHGFNIILLMSFLTVLAGTLLFYYRKYTIKVSQFLFQRFFYMDLSGWSQKAIDKFLDFTKANTRTFQHGYHRFYLMVIFIVTTLLLTIGLIYSGEVSLFSDKKISLYYPLYIVSGIVIISSVVVMFSQSRLLSLISLGFAGFSIAILFMIFGAVDLAITMILTETILIMLLVVVIRHLPGYLNISSLKSRIRDVLISLLFGGVMTIVALQTRHVNMGPSVSDYFIENSFLKAFGKNIVNVILVDFRALDTLGEITVLVIAAVGVIALVKMRKEKEKISSKNE